MWAVKHKSGRVLFVTSNERTANNRRDMGWIVEEVKMTSREQFEAWVKTTNSDLERYKTGIHKGDFKNPVMRKMWLAWQASRAAIEIELPEPCSPGDFCVDIPAQAHHEVVEAIESVGLKVKK